MKIVSINSVLYGSTGKIMKEISDLSIMNGDEHIIFSGYCKKKIKADNYIQIGTKLSKSINIFLSYLTGNELSFSFFSTLQLIRKLKKIKPDIIHLHNLHNNYLNIKVLFKYIKKNNIQVVWTLHDCWSFTGHCPHFIYEKCYKWKNGCSKCAKYKSYPPSLFDNSRKMWKYKKRVFTSLSKLTIVTPSNWLADMVKQSFLVKYDVITINNGIDLNIFSYKKSEFRNNYNIDSDKFVILGVSFGWPVSKGLDVFVELAKRLDDSYRIVLVGTNDEIDRKLPDNIISIHRTSNQEELAKIYSAADLFVNPTREDNYPTVNMESIACGTPVLTFNTGGSPEILDENSGLVVECDNIDLLEKNIKKIKNEKPFNRNGCVKFATRFNKFDRFNEYIDLYNKLLINN